MSFAAAQRVADAVLYEGYLLYPYHAGSQKNRVRFQFGVVAPRDERPGGASEAWEMQTECLLEATPAAVVDVRVRFLQLQARTVEAAVGPGAPGRRFRPVPSLLTDGEAVVPWDEAIEQAVDVTGQALAGLLREERAVPFAVRGGRVVEVTRDTDGSPAGRIVRRRWPIAGVIRLRAEPVAGLVRLRVRIENLTPPGRAGGARDAALRRSLLGCHTLLAVRGGAFVSLIDPPAEAVPAAAGCVNLHTWPVLGGADGQRDVVLSSPIILYDHPEVAPESQGDLFDATEIDEILTLRIMTLTDEEKRAARATDARARAIIDAADAMPPEMLDRLHGAIRYLRSSRGTETPRAGEAPPAKGDPEPPDPAMGDAAPPDPADPVDAIRPWAPDEPAWPTWTEPRDGRTDLPPSVWEPAARADPDRAAVEVAGVLVARGASVRLRPGRRADAMDLFLAGRTGTVEAVFESVDDDVHVAVTIDDDPGADLHRATGRYYYFAPDELEPISPPPPPATSGLAPVLLEPSARSLGR